MIGWGKSSWGCWAIVACIAAITAAGGARGVETFIPTEVPLQKVFVPTSGYDDNDRVEIVVKGVLPNPCFTLGKTVAEPIPGTNQFKIHQHAWMTLMGPCTGEIMNDPIPYTSVAEVGILPVASYSVTFNAGTQKPGLATFQVDKAMSADVDNFRYAALQTVDIKEITWEEDDVIATLNGVFSSKCQSLEKTVVEIQGDLIVVMPKLITREDPNCEKRMIPFSEKLNLGPLKMGSYLIHARSRGGKAIYRPFEVWPRVR